MVREYALRAKWSEGTLKEKDLFVYPMPQQIGLTMDVDDGLVVAKVTDDSPAAQTGIARGDQLVALGGQPLVSTADIQWVLHHSPAQAELAVEVRRDGKSLQKTLTLSGDWKKSDIAWRASSWYGLRQGVKFEPLPTAEKQQRGIAPERMALAIKGLFGKGGPHLKQRGVQTNDVVVAVNDRTDLLTETDFLAYLRLEHGPKDAIKLTILRGDKRREISVPLW
jgi:S1-C subfamily serine protease